MILKSHTACIFTLYLYLISFNTSYAQPESQTVNEYGRLKVSNGEIVFSGDPNSFSIKLKFFKSPECSTEKVSAPNRLLIQCKGEFLNNAKALEIKGNNIANKIRFGISDSKSRIVVDIKGEMPELAVIKSADGHQNYNLYLNSQVTSLTPAAAKSATNTPSPNPTNSAVNTIFTAKNTPSAIAQKATYTASPGVSHTAVPVASVTPAQSVTPGKVPVITPPPRPKLLFGETELYNLQFTKDKTTGKTAVKINLKDQTTAEIRQDSETVYTLKINKARAAAPIFLKPQNAPEGFSPFVSVSPSEDIKEGQAVNLMVKIDLDKPAELNISQKKGEILLQAD